MCILQDIAEQRIIFLQLFFGVSCIGIEIAFDTGATRYEHTQQQPHAEAGKNMKQFF
jgi:hypothetical protein